MQNAIHYFLATIIGSLVSVMVIFNTRLGEASTMALSFIANHVVSIVVLTLILLIVRLKRGRPAERKKAPWYLWFGGVFGYFILNSNYVTIINVGASLMMATAVFGQSLASLIFDLTGFMGRKIYPVSRYKALSLSLSLVGIVVMGFEGGTFAISYLLLGTLTGVITMVQMVYNSRFATYKGVFFSARQNVISGLIFALIIYAFTQAERTIEAFKGIGQIPMPLLVGGGLLSVVVVSGSNFVLPKLPVIYSALLMSAAQIITSLAIDYYFYNLFSYPLLIGTLIILLSMVLNVVVDLKEREKLV
ncbi:MAG: DMT family transporter [Sphaerochaetaceae bacterium]|jgi:transporter family-2 protein|nr:DMT family transporter [Sphaerochaetaceae bacterium]HHU88374.1 hypothetical protein [Spirochaetales bacterium]